MMFLSFLNSFLGFTLNKKLRLLFTFQFLKEVLRTGITIQYYAIVSRNEILDLIKMIPVLKDSLKL